jgi:hypothetical protein
MTSAELFPVGCKVSLRRFQHGLVVKRARGRVTVRWPGPDCLARHSPESLELAGPALNTP